MPDTLRQIAPNVWIYPRDEDPNRTQPNVGIIVTGEHTVLVDAGNCPRHARRIMIALDDIEAPAVSHIIYTHSHWDHVFGAMVFGAPAIAHESCRRQLLETAAKPWSHAYVQEEIMRFPQQEANLRAMARAVEDWRNFRIVLPEVVFSKQIRLYLDDLLLEIDHVGGDHAPDSLIVRLPDQRVLFAGDCFYPPPSYLREPDDTFNFGMIQTLLRDDIDWYIDGHSNPFDRAAFHALAQGNLNP
jgi:glyoxylase-like metal-dependent hydrolase (beta-lactamase superfamily II)